MMDAFMSALNAADEQSKKLPLTSQFGTFESDRHPAWVFFYDHLGCLLKDVTFRNHLGKELEKIQAIEADEFSILDIGCRTHQCMRSISYGHQMKHRYTGIDIRADVPPLLGWGLSSYKFVRAATNMAEVSLTDTFDIVIIDVEPHGDEWYIYQHVKKHLAEYHLVILMCIGQMTGGDFMFENFRTSAGDLLHHWIVSGRDVFCVMKNRLNS